MPEEQTAPIFRSLCESPSVIIEEFVSFGHVGGPWPSTEHLHPTLQLIFLSQHNSLRADWVTDSGAKCEKRISGSAICVTPAFQPHSMEFDETHGIVMMAIATDLLGEEGPRRNCEWMGRGLYGESDPFLQHLGELLFEARGEGIPITRLHAESTAVILLEHLNRREGRWARKPLGKCGRLPEVVEFIHSNLENELSIATLSRIAQTSSFHFARQFKASTGLTPHQFVLEQRIEMAKRLLSRSDLAIAEVAQGCGFATQAHLTTTFRRYLGTTPKEFRSYVSSPRPHEQDSKKG